MTTQINLPKWASKFLNEKSSERIAAKITEVEKTTSGEIVVMVVRRSSLIGHVPFLVFLFMASVTLAVDWYYHLLSSLFFIFVWLPISYFAARLKWVQRMATDPDNRVFQVRERAELEFHRNKMVNTKARTGVFIFLSLMEREAVVLADQLIAAKYAAESWGQVVDLVTSGVKNKNTEAGLISAIELCGDRLKTYFPVENGDKNELSNHLIVKE